MQVTHELYKLPQAPVIRSVVRIYDDPSRPLVLETFTNIRDEEQRHSFDALSGQPKYIFTFYYEQLTYRLTKALIKRIESRQHHSSDKLSLHPLVFLAGDMTLTRLKQRL